MGEERASGTLADYLAEHEKLPLGEGLAILDGLLRTVGEMHRTDTADGALHPGRIIAVGPGQVALIPKAEALPYAEADAYLSPQQRDGKPADVRADVYALGVLAYKILMGVLPYEGDVTEPADPHAYLPNLTDRVCRTLIIAVQKNLTERFGDALTFRAALRGESTVALDTPTLRWARADGIPEGDTGAADAFAGEVTSPEDASNEGESGGS